METMTAMEVSASLPKNIPSNLLNKDSAAEGKMFPMSRSDDNLKHIFFCFPGSELELHT